MITRQQPPRRWRGRRRPRLLRCCRATMPHLDIGSNGVGQPELAPLPPTWMTLERFGTDGIGSFPAS